MEKCGNIQVWVLSRDLAIPGLQLRGIYPSAAAPGQRWLDGRTWFFLEFILCTVSLLWGCHQST